MYVLFVFFLLFFNFNLIMLGCFSLISCLLSVFQDETYFLVLAIFLFNISWEHHTWVTHIHHSCFSLPTSSVSSHVRHFLHINPNDHALVSFISCQTVVCIKLFSFKQFQHCLSWIWVTFIICFPSFNLLGPGLFYFIVLQNTKLSCHPKIFPVF